jgi:hypothetical protein
VVPLRYRDRFRDMRVTYENGTWEMCWQCRICERIIKRNTAGAQSHIAKHVREGRDASFYQPPSEGAR